jgi:hypothetical protein
VRGFGHPQTGTIGDHENRAMLKAPHTAQEAAYLFATQNHWQGLWLLRERDFL